jgi:hypothetical protein
MKKWSVPAVSSSSVALATNEVAPVVVGMVIIGTVAMAGIGFGVYCTSRGRPFEFEMGITKGVRMNCR